MVDDRTRILVMGAFGGFIGAMLMAAILVSSKALMGLPPMADFLIMGSFAGAQTNVAVQAGWILHLSTGLVLGLAFSTVTLSVPGLAIARTGKIATVGVIFGLAVYLTVFVPTLLMGFAPIMTAMMGPAAGAMLPTILVIGFTEHVLFGGVLGTTIAIGMRS